MTDHVHPCGEGNTPRTEERERARVMGLALGEMAQALREVHQMAISFERRAQRAEHALVVSLDARIETGERVRDHEPDRARRLKLEQAVKDLRLERAEVLETLDGPGYGKGERAERVAALLKDQGGVWDGGSPPSSMQRR